MRGDFPPIWGVFLPGVDTPIGTLYNLLMTYEALTAPTYSPRTCRRCKGTGHVNHTFLGGRCFSCQGTGSEMVESGRRPLAADELAKVTEYQAGIAAREAREAARKARRA